jgi:hypothetical protein
MFYSFRGRFSGVIIMMWKRVSLPVEIEEIEEIEEV